MFFHTSLLHIVCIVLCLLCTGCGYKPVHQLASIFPNNDVSLRITAIENPTLIATLPYYFRSALTKIMEERAIAHIKDDLPTQYEMEITIHSYRTVPRTIVQDDVILLYSAEILFSATVYETQKGTVFWRSGTITSSNIYQTFAPEIIIENLVNSAVTDLANAMQLAF